MRPSIYGLRSVTECFVMHHNDLVNTMQYQERKSRYCPAVSIDVAERDLDMHQRHQSDMRLDL